MGASVGAWVPRLLTAAVWAGVAGSAVYWALTLGAKPQSMPANATVSGLEASLQGDIVRLFGERAAAGASPVAAPPPAASRFRVLGVVGSVRGGDGVALLSVDGKPPKAFRLGARVDPDWALEAVTQKQVRLSPVKGGASITLDLPALAQAATGQLPAVDVNGAANGNPAGNGSSLLPGGMPGRGGALGMPVQPGVAADRPNPAPGLQPPPSLQMPQVRPDGTVVPPEPAASGPGA